MVSSCGIAALKDLRDDSVKKTFSIIVPFREVGDYERECIHALEKQKGNFEIILLPDSKIKEKFDKSKVYHTGPVKPSVKRNMGVSKAKGKYIAFIDSDAYPRKDWMKNTLKYLKDERVGILGGPNIQPENDSVMQKAGGDVLSSPLGAGSFSMRYSIKESKDVTELPSCNMFIRKSMFEKIGGFDTSLLTAEDAKLCFELLKLGKKILYSPDVVVYHHRRALFRPHLRQIWRYGRDKAKVFRILSPKKNIIYFLPSLFVIFIFSGTFITFNPWFNTPILPAIYTYVMILYLFLVFLGSISKSLKRFPLIFVGIISTHIVYGIGFLRGLFSVGSKSN